jgi:hypothetical protein
MQLYKRDSPADSVEKVTWETKVSPAMLDLQDWLADVVTKVIVEKKEKSEIVAKLEKMGQSVTWARRDQKEPLATLEMMD